MTDVAAAYDKIARDYAEHFRDAYAARPVDRAVLAAFAELVPPGRVLDVGCGPGAVTGMLAAHGLAVSGVDLSRGMVAEARAAFPSLPFAVGSMTALPARDASLTGVVSWYSTVHLAEPELATAVGEFRRVLVPGGQLLIAFQVGGPADTLVLDTAFGKHLGLAFLRRSPNALITQLAAAGLTVHTRLTRAPLDTDTAPQAFLIASR